MAVDEEDSPMQNLVHKSTQKSLHRPESRSKSTAMASPPKIDVGVQCDLIVPHCYESEEEIEKNYLDSAADDEYDFNQMEDIDSDEECKWENEIDSEKHFADKLEGHNDERFIVFKNCLMKLFKTCPACCGEAEACVIEVQGTLVKIQQWCTDHHCKHDLVWQSQTYVNNMPAGNPLMSSSIVMA
ncbi:hypothetical protein QZH41_015433, partial [Actinostola sp. cb2023]